jgi:hypothetical protein
VTNPAKMELQTVAIRGFPVAVFLEARRHSEALLRELAFIVDGGGDNAELPRRLLDVVERVRARAAGMNTGAERAIEEAVVRKDASIDFDMLVPARLARGAPEFEVLLDEIDEYCRTGDLLTLATSPDVREFRRWYLHELTYQIEGGRPTPWSEWITRS